MCNEHLRFYYQWDLCVWHLDLVGLAPHQAPHRCIELSDCLRRHRMCTLMDKSQLLWLWRAREAATMTSVQLIQKFFSSLMMMTLLLLPWLIFFYFFCLFFICKFSDSLSILSTISFYCVMVKMTLHGQKPHENFLFRVHSLSSPSHMSIFFTWTANRKKNLIRFTVLTILASEK